MNRLVKCLIALSPVVALALTGVVVSGQTPKKDNPQEGKRVVTITDAAGRTHTRVLPIKQAEREAAADRLSAKIKAKKGVVGGGAIGLAALPYFGPTVGAGTLLVGANGELVPDYSGTIANYAKSPAPTVDPVTGAISGGIRKFVDTLPGLGPGGANNLLNYIPVAVADTTSYPGSDYYEIELVEYSQQLHSDLPPTRLRGYHQTNMGVTDPPMYLGPVIVAQKGVPVRIKFTNNLPLGAAGNLFVPNDVTIMGAGPGPLNTDFATTADVLCKKDAAGVIPAMCYSENRATIHLHGGVTPWISDGTPHQWITPAGETMSAYKEGVSVYNVPDMPNPGKPGDPLAGATNPTGSGSQTFYFTNDQSARLMFYHDHASGTTRLNVYIGEAAGYLLQDPTEADLVARGLIPAEQIPLILQEKAFVDAATIAAEDPTWNWGTGVAAPYTDVRGGSTMLRAPVTGDLWWPHVYMPAQNPYDISGMNAMGRWHYGPWFWPPTVIPYGPIPNPYYDAINAPWQPLEVPAAPNPSWGAEGFLDTPVINGTAYPVLHLEPKAYRFRILNAANDRFMNLQLYEPTSIVSAITLTGGGSGYTDPTRDLSPVVTITDAGPGKGATAIATVDQDPLSPTYGQVVAIDMATVGTGYVSATVTIAPPFLGGAPALATATVYSAPTEVGMLPAVTTAGFPPRWPTDGREGGVPDPAKTGPHFVQIGTEGGFLPMPVVVANQPIVWNADPTTFNFGNVADFGLLLGPAERADVIVDFTAWSGKEFIVFNDAPAALPALDPRNDYYTSNPDRQDTGGAPSTLPGYGPNIKTIMKIVVDQPVSTPSTFDLPGLMAFWKPDPLADGVTRPVEGVFQRGQDPIIVGQTAYNEAYGTTFPSTYPGWGIVRIADTSTTITTVAGTQVTLPLAPKAIHDEMGATFDDYGRMASKLGLELPASTAFVQNFVMQGYNDPATELIKLSQFGTPIGDPLADGTQLWKITHNGVDTHPVHFHLFHVQLVNRVGWDNMVRLPHPTELGWKDTLRISPLEDTIVALRPIAPTPQSLPWELPNSIRPLNPHTPLGTTVGFTHRDPLGNNITVFNDLANFGWEYVWHCHILSHEENDMMRAVNFAVPPQVAPSGLTAAIVGGGNNRRAVLNWTASTSLNVSGYTIQRAIDPAFTMGIVTTQVGLVTTYTDPIGRITTPFFYRVAASNTVGSTVPGFPTISSESAWSNTADVNPVLAPSGLVARLGAVLGQVVLTFTDNATNETGFVIERAPDGVTFATLIQLPARNNTGSVTYTDPSGVAGLTYTYRVKAISGVVSSAWSNLAVVSLAIPLEPSGLTGVGVAVNNNSGSITLTWVDNSNNEASFTIQRADDVNFTIGVATNTVGADVTTYTATGRTRGLTYFYRVAAVNGYGASVWSNVIAVLVP